MDHSPCGPNFGPAGDSEIETKNEIHQDGNIASNQPAPNPETKIENLVPQSGSCGDSSVEGQQFENRSSTIPTGNFVSIEPNRQLHWQRVNEELNDRPDLLDPETDSDAEFKDCIDMDQRNSGQRSPQEFHDFPGQQGVVRERRRSPTITPTQNSEMAESSSSDSDFENFDAAESEEDWLSYEPFIIFRNLTTGTVQYDRGPLKFTNIWIGDRFILQTSLTLENITDEYLTYKAFVSCPKRVQVDSMYGLIQPRGFHKFQLNTIQSYRETCFEDIMLENFVVYTAPVYLLSVNERRKEDKNWDKVKLEHLVDFWDMSLNSHWLFPRPDIVKVGFSSDVMPSGFGFELRSKWRSIVNWSILRIWGSEKRAKSSFLFRNWERFSNFCDAIEEQKLRNKEQDVWNHVNSWNYSDRVRLWWQRRSFWPDMFTCCQGLIYFGFLTALMVSFSSELLYRETTKPKDKKRIQLW